MSSSTELSSSSIGLSRSTDTLSAQQQQSPGSSRSSPTSPERMYVVKRDGTREEVSFDKILERVRRCCEQGVPLTQVRQFELVQLVIRGVVPEVQTRHLDELLVQICIGRFTHHWHYDALATRIVVSGRLHKDLKLSFSESVRLQYKHVYHQNGRRACLVSDELMTFVERHADVLDRAVHPSRDYDYTYFGLMTLIRQQYLRSLDSGPASDKSKSQSQLVETPQYMWMRVACGLWGVHVPEETSRYHDLRYDEQRACATEDALYSDEQRLEHVLELYELLSTKRATFATPTLLNAGSTVPQLASCVLLQVQEDSIAGIYKTLRDAALISQRGAGLGIAVHKVRAAGAVIARSHGTSRGLRPMLKVFNDTAQYADQGGGKRAGSFATYLSPDHPDFLSWLQLRTEREPQESRCPDLYYALWMPDLFMKRVAEDGPWSFFCPSEAPGLADVHSDEYEALYTRYEREGRAREVLFHGTRAREHSAVALWKEVLQTQAANGTPYLLFKDACNRKSNQRHLGTIQQSNLCTEILEYTSAEETAVCNLGSLCLSRFLMPSSRSQNVTSSSEHGQATRLQEVYGPSQRRYDFEALRRATYTLTRSLNRVIDVTHYPVPEMRCSNLRHRPIGLGVQGLQELFHLLHVPFTGAEARLLNRRIFETIQYAALQASVDMARELAEFRRHSNDVKTPFLGAYASYEGSPLSEGTLQADMWQRDLSYENPDILWDWTALRASIARHGARNSLLVAPMPTASTSQIMGNTECIEPCTSNMYVRKTKAGEHWQYSRTLQDVLLKRGLWSDELRRELIAAGGSVQALRTVPIPEDVCAVYRTVWECSQRALAEMALDRAPFICQNQSFNVHIRRPTLSQLNTLYFMLWRGGAKSGCYYLRTSGKARQDQTTVTSDPLASLAQTQRNHEVHEQRFQTKKDEEEDEMAAAPPVDRCEPGCDSCG